MSAHITFGNVVWPNSALIIVLWRKFWSNKIYPACNRILNYSYIAEFYTCPTEDYVPWNIVDKIEHQEMYTLFKLVRLISVKDDVKCVKIKSYAWRQNGEASLLALSCSNGKSFYVVMWSGWSFPSPHLGRVRKSKFYSLLLILSLTVILIWNRILYLKIIAQYRNW